MANSPEYVAGANASLSALQTIDRIAAHYRNGEATDSKSFFRDRELIKAVMVNHAGTLSPFLKGFITTLTEYIDLVMQDSTGPILDFWKPESVMTPSEVNAERAELFHDHGSEVEEHPETTPAAKIPLPPIPERRLKYEPDDPLSQSRFNLLPFESAKGQYETNRWDVPPIGDGDVEYRRAEVIGMHYAAHFAQQLKDIPDYVGQNGLGHIVQAIDFKDESRAQSYWIAFFSELERYIYRGVKRLDIWKDLDKNIKYQDKIFAEADREDAEAWAKMEEVA